MASVIQAIRSYPLTLLLAVLCFVLSLALATASLGKMLGGDDEGSGMGGTGKQGDFGGSGLGGTGAPSPFFSINDNDQQPAETLQQSQPGLPDAASDVLQEHLIDLQPWLPFRQRVLESASIERPDNDITALLRERAPIPEGGYIGEAPGPAEQMMRDLADAAVRDQAETVLEINIQVEVINPTRNLSERLQAPVMPQITDSDNEPDVDESAPQQQGTAPAPSELAGQQVEDMAVDLLPAHDEETGRAARDRIQRPELPPFQRTRPVHRASVAAPRPQPMRL